MTSTSRLSRRCGVVVVFWLASGLPAAAQTPRDLSEIPFEDLVEMRVQEVFGASDRLQPVTEVPSSVSIITAHDISRNGYRTLADILRGVRGFYITDDRNYSYVGARGFSRAGDYNSRVLLLVNGHRVNDNVYDQAYVGSDFLLDAAMFERVEIIRGPASSLYGTNALFATVNVITRTGASLNGASFNVETGTLGSQLVRGSAGRRLENGMDFALAGAHERSTGITQLYLPEFDTPDSNGGIAENLDGEHSTHLYGRFGLNNLTLTGAFGYRNKYVPTASFDSVFNSQDPAEQTTDRKLTVLAQYVRTVRGARVTTEAAIDHFSYRGVYPYADEEPQPPLVFRDGFSGLRLTAGTRATRPLFGRQTLTVGAELVDNIDQNQWGTYPFESADNFVLDQSSRQVAAYVQDEIKLRPWLIVNGGLRHDRFSQFSRTTPRGAVIVMPSSNHSLKYLYGQAFRAPNAYELYYYRDASDSLQPESIRTHEWVWEAYFGERVRTVVSTYRYRAMELIDLGIVESDVPFGEGFGFANSGTTRAAGLEFESEIRLKRGAQALASYTLQNANDVATGLRLTNSPRHMAKLRFSVPGPREGSFASLEWMYLSTRTTLAGNTVDPASLANATFNLPLGRSVTFTGQVRNLFDVRYADPGSEEHVGDSIEQNGRTARVGLRWSFWNPR
jgi:outer membrane receptor for ferrienterochelin and colicins